MCGTLVGSYVTSIRGLWRSGLDRWTGDRVVLGSNPAAATTLKVVGPLHGVYVRGSKISQQFALDMCNLSWTPPPLEKDN